MYPLAFVCSFQRLLRTSLYGLERVFDLENVPIGARYIVRWGKELIAETEIPEDCLPLACNQRSCVTGSSTYRKELYHNLKP